MSSAKTEFYKPECSSCTLGLVQLAYKRALWFILFREPLLFGMRMMALWHGVNADRHTVTQTRCKGCIRFMKSELKIKSPTFRVLNDLVNPVFNKLRDSLVTQDEKKEARQFALDALKSDSASTHIKE